MFVVANEQTIEITEEVLLLRRKEAAAAAGRCRLPSLNKHRGRSRMAEPLRPRIKRAFACASEQRRHLVNAPIDTFLINGSALDEAKIQRHLGADIFASLFGDGDIVMSANRLLKPKSDQDSTDDGYDFARKLPEGTRRLWLVNVHSARMLCFAHNRGKTSLLTQPMRFTI
jgi:hypothetical protein